REGAESVNQTRRPRTSLNDISKYGHPRTNNYTPQILIPLDSSKHSQHLIQKRSRVRCHIFHPIFFGSLQTVEHLNHQGPNKVSKDEVYLLVIAARRWRRANIIWRAKKRQRRVK